MIAPLEAKAASLWSRKQSPGSLPGGSWSTASMANGKAIETVKEPWIRIAKGCRSTRQ